MPLKPRRPDWNRPLTRSLQINRKGPGIKLVTLADARAFLLDHFGGTIRNAHLEHAIDCLFAAAEGPDDFTTAKQATDAVAVVIRERGWG